jgi:hypothetical protein
MIVAVFFGALIILGLMFMALSGLDNKGVQFFRIGMMLLVMGLIGLGALFFVWA